LDVLRVRLFAMQCQTLVARRLRGSLGQWNRCVTARVKPAAGTFISTEVSVMERAPFSKAPSHKGAGTRMPTYVDKVVETENLGYVDKVVETENLGNPEIFDQSEQWPADISSSDAHSSQWHGTDSSLVGGRPSQASGSSSWPPSISASQLSSSDPSEHSSGAEEAQMSGLPRQHKYGRANF